MPERGFEKKPLSLAEIRYNIKVELGNGRMTGDISRLKKFIEAYRDEIPRELLNDDKEILDSVWKWKRAAQPEEADVVISYLDSIFPPDKTT